MSSTGCQKVIGADFQEFEIAGPGIGCYEECPAGWHCNIDIGECQCEPALCGSPGLPAHECGGFIEPRCGQPVDCGACPSGQQCINDSNGTPNRCAPEGATPCQPQTCADLGQTSGVHFTCGILIDCNPVPDCQGECSSKQVCTASGCCTPAPPENVGCGKFPDGCGRVIEVGCKGDATCIEGECCALTTAEANCDGMACGQNKTHCEGLYTECPGSCGESEGECNTSVFHPFCDLKCPQGRKCPEQGAVCGLNSDGCGGEIQCNGSCPGSGVCTRDLTCCTPSCPTTPKVCGANDNGCGAMIQCPGPCPAGNTCRNAGDGTFACTP